jgi:SAM-dependent methyltransferase
MSEKHYFEQVEHTQTYLIPYFKKHIQNFEQLKVLEVGCAEGGFLDVLYELGMNVAGVELSPDRVEIAKQKNPKMNVMVGDITADDVAEKINDQFDLIVLRDVIEHIPDRIATFNNISKLLKPGGFLFVSFPPRFSGFAGHQQVGRTFLRYLPYYHLLPNFLIKSLGKLFNEREFVIESAILNYKIGLSIRAFEKYYTNSGFKVVQKDLFLFRPLYKIRFNLNPRKFPNIPILREAFAFGCEVLLKKD